MTQLVRLLFMVSMVCLVPLPLVCLIIKMVYSMVVELSYLEFSA